MRAWLIGGLAVMAVTPASAHCYSRWYYPYPQHCGARRAPAPILHRAAEQSHDWYVEIVLPDAVVKGDVDERAQALDELKAKLR
jgi:hypothetical protein